MRRLLRASRRRLGDARDRARGSSFWRRISGVPFALALVTLLAVGMVAVLLFNTRIQDQQRQLDDLQASAQRLDYHEAALEQSVDQLGTTGTLGSKAANLGMVPNPNPLVIQMPDGSLHGKPQAAVGTEMPGIVPSVSPSPNVPAAAGSTPGGR